MTLLQTVGLLLVVGPVAYIACRLLLEQLQIGWPPAGYDVNDFDATPHWDKVRRG